MSGTPPRPLHPVSVALRLVIGASWGLFCLLPTLAIATLLLPWRGLRVRLGNLYARVAALPFVRIMGFDWHIDHPERLGGQQAIYLCNHTSSLDLFLGSGLCPMGGCGTAKKEIIYIPAIGQAFWLTGHLRLDRGNTDKAKASMRELAEVVGRHALSVWVWPEGTRAKDGRLQPFKKGFVHMAVATGLPIVPVVLVGAHKHWPAKGFRLVPGTIEVKVLPAISTVGWTVEGADAHIAELQAVYTRELPADQRPLLGPTVPSLE
jgi:lysophosphatidate acyltransferase